MIRGVSIRWRGELLPRALAFWAAMALAVAAWVLVIAAWYGLVAVLAAVIG